MHRSAQETGADGWTFLAQASCERVELVYARDARIPERWKGTLGAGSDDDCGEQGFVRGETRWVTSSPRLATLLAREHAEGDRQVRLIGQNEMIAGAMYSPRLVKKVMRALGKELADDGRLDSVSLYSAGPTADFPVLDTQEWQEDDHDQQGNLLDPLKVKEGKQEEIEWVLRQKLFDHVPGSECAKRQGELHSLKRVLKKR